MDILTIFITGLFAGGLTCLAVQGGLLASAVVNQEKKSAQELSKAEQILPIVSFLLARLAAYTLFGFFLGLLGSAFQLSLELMIALQFMVALFMIGTALNLLGAHPIFRYFAIQPPKFLTKLIKNQTKSQSIFGPALLGAFTVFIPCGATQAMMAYAVSTASPLVGAITMFVFILGTSPLFFILGYLTRKVNVKVGSIFNKLAAGAIIAIALYNLNGALTLSGSNFTFEYIFLRGSEVTTNRGPSVNEATIYFNSGGYETEPASINVAAGSILKLRLVNKNGGGCVQSFTIPKFRIQQIVRVGTESEISLEIPKTPGTIPFMCSMGMFKGNINVI